MTRTLNIIVGLVLLAGVAMAMTKLFIPEMIPSPTPTPTQSPNAVYVYGGYRCFEDEQCMALLRDQYQIDVIGEFRKGTFAMADDYKSTVDCIWPGSITGIEYFQTKQPEVKIRKSAVIFQTPIALFTWKELLLELQEAGLVYTQDEVYFLRMQPLVDAMIAEKQWNDIGVGIPGYVRVESTDPAKSSSGMLWLEMIGSFLVPDHSTGGKVITSAGLQANPEILPTLYTYWENQGLQVETTSKLFDKFISSGAGMPVIVAYESSFIDWYEAQSDDMKAQATKIVGIYPENTINTDHTLASLTPACDPLVDALAHDAQLQKLGWEKAGMRNGTGGIGVKPQSAPWFAASVPFIPEAKIDVYQSIKDVLK